MSLLDAALAFALTMAALATVVTIIMEIAMMALGLKARDQVKLIGKLVEDVVQARFGEMDDHQKWLAVRRILNNTVLAKKSQMADQEGGQSYIFGKARGVHDKVSLEHVLRRLLENADLDPLSQMRDELRANLKAVALKYDEFRSSLAMNFGRRARTRSLVVGISLAAVLNVDGLRLFETFASNPQLTSSVITEMEPILEAAGEAQKEMEEQLKTLNLQETTVENLNTAVGDLKAELGVIRQLGLPIGGDYYPHCYIRAGDSSSASERAKLDPLCEPASPISGERLKDPFGWALRILITGLLMGLGAPFWYDVAKRLAQVRQAFGAKGGVAERHRGAEGDETPEAMDALIDRVVDDARLKAALSGQPGKPKTGP